MFVGAAKISALQKKTDYFHQKNTTSPNTAYAVRPLVTGSLSSTSKGLIQYKESGFLKEAFSPTFPSSHRRYLRSVVTSRIIIAPVLVGNVAHAGQLGEIVFKIFALL